MKTRREKDLSRWLDGELPAGRAQELQADVAAHPELSKQAEAWKQIGALLREEPVPALQTPEAAWADVQRALRNAKARHSETEATGLFGHRLAWAGGLMALLLLLGFAGYTLRGGRAGAGAAVALAEPSGPALAGVEVEWVETESPGSTSMIYQDAETGLTVIWMVEAEELEAPDADS